MRIDDLVFDDRGLLPAIVQDAGTKEVLMLAYMDAQAVRRSIETETTWFWSRSRNEYWNKGATSGNTQKIVDIRFDCDADALLVLVDPAGPACHTGEYSCFHRDLAPNESG
jgi:phosphoribosyl-AMP cyclohydrolase / phosphoribosyl-ATP pyrophosphohydrolase